MAMAPGEEPDKLFCQINKDSSRASIRMAGNRARVFGTHANPIQLEENRMSRIWKRTAFLLVGLAVQASVIARAQTDVAASLYGAFTGTTTGNNVAQSPSNAAGGLLEVRHISNPIVGYEGTYSFNRANQSYTAINILCPAGSGPCIPTPTPVSANAHEVTGDWVASLKIANLRPFALAGAGILFNVPVTGQIGNNSTNTSTKPVFVYGAGLDWGLLPHIGLRLQYRGNLYKAPDDLTILYTTTGAFTHTAEPMIGVYLRL
jgi:opacity protein-like surface antigen